MSKHELEDAIRAQLINNVSIEDIVEKLDVSRSRVVNVQHNLNRALAKGELLEGIVEDSSVKNTLMLLNTRSQQAALAVTEKAKIMAATAETAGELLTLAETVSKIQTAFFVNNAPNVNIQNNFGESNGSSSKYGRFLQDTPGSIDN